MSSHLQPLAATQTLAAHTRHAVMAAIADGALEPGGRPRLADQLPLPQLRLPFCVTTEIGPAELDGLADRLLAEIAALPEAV